jgi:formylglycine-generating enzyme required for sulfatase activity
LLGERAQQVKRILRVFKNRSNSITDNLLSSFIYDVGKYIVLFMILLIGGMMYKMWVDLTGTAHDSESNQRKEFDVFFDCLGCPKMVVLPRGHFNMGSVPEEVGHEQGESPIHKVTLPHQIAVGVFAVSFDEWDLCVGSGGCNDYRPEAEGWGRGNKPVINVSWRQAKSYVFWLSNKTGKTYRLLSEAEWEYGARAGSLTPFWWGNSITSKFANYVGTLTYAEGAPSDFRGSTVAVDKFPPNNWGLYQVHGNVWQWVEDCYHENYEGAPSDGSPWIEDTCKFHILRGGCWLSGPKELRSASRSRADENGKSRFISFRVARDLESDVK